MIDQYDKLKENINRIPELPGVYKMLDAKGTIIYIGKSKSLRKRVKSYFNNSPKWEKVKKLVSLIKSIDYIVTDTHLEARLLECELIKEIKPYFNAQMKHDKKYVYLNISTYNIHNSLDVSLERKENSYGPFRSKSIIENLMVELKHIYPIRKIEDDYQFDYNIIPGKMDKDTFNKNKEVLEELFQSPDKLTKIMKHLEDRMLLASMEYRFEKAKVYRDMINNISYLSYGLSGYKNLMGKRIVVKIPIQEGHKLFYIHDGVILYKKVYKRITSTNIENFIKKSEQIIVVKSYGENEKANKDFVDILYSEILSLKEDDIIFCS